MGEVLLPSDCTVSARAARSFLCSFASSRLCVSVFHVLDRRGLWDPRVFAVQLSFFAVGRSFRVNLIQRDSLGPGQARLGAAHRGAAFRVGRLDSVW